MRFDYLNASIDAVVDGLESFEKIYALEQAEYIPLRTLPGETGEDGKANSAITRWQLTPEQRQAIANGADIMLEVVHFRGPLAPVRMMILDQSGFSTDEEKKVFLQWFCCQTNGPYFKQIP